MTWISNFKRWLSYTDLDLFPMDYTENHIVIHRESFPKLRLGNLKACRDWGYAGDYVKAMWLMLQQSEPDDYVVCTGVTSSIEQFLEIAFREAGIENWENLVTKDPKYYRPYDVPYLRGDYSKAKRVLGWEPEYDLERLIKLMFDGKLQTVS